MSTLTQALADLQTATTAIQSAAGKVPAPLPRQIFALVNGSTGFTMTPTILAALQTQLDRDLRPAWNVDAQLISVTGSPSTLPTADWYLLITDNGTVADALGWHDQLSGRPYGEIDVTPTLQSGVTVSSVLSHEICETLVNPFVDAYVMNTAGTNLYPHEVCDPVQNDSYQINGVTVSNFILPSYFEGGAAPWDYLKKLTGPLPAMTTGGYLSLLAITASGQWQQIGADRLAGIGAKRSEQWKKVGPKIGR